MEIISKVNEHVKTIKENLDLGKRGSGDSGRENNVVVLDQIKLEKDEIKLEDRSET